MTNAEIEALTVEELRLAVAKAKGWTFWVTDKPFYAVAMPGKEPPYSPEYRTRVDDPENYRVSWEGSNWSADTAASMELAEEMPYYTIQRISDNKCIAVLFPERDLLTGKAASGTTIPTAICRAYLMVQQAK